MAPGELILEAATAVDHLETQDWAAARDLASVPTSKNRTAASIIIISLPGAAMRVCITIRNPFGLMLAPLNGSFMRHGTVE